MTPPDSPPEPVLVGPHRLDQLPVRVRVAVDEALLQSFAEAVRSHPASLLRPGDNRFRLHTRDAGIELQVFSLDPMGRPAPSPGGGDSALWIAGQLTPMGMMNGGRLMDGDAIERVMAAFLAGETVTESPRPRVDPAPAQAPDGPAEGSGSDGLGEVEETGDESASGQLSLLG